MFAGDVASLSKPVVGLIAIVTLSCGLSAQTCSEFTVASIKVNPGGIGGRNPELEPGGRRFIATGQYLMALLMFTYDVSPLQILGVPNTHFQDRYDIEASCDAPMTMAQLPHLLQLLLEARFHLAIHREFKEQPVYALVAAKGGPKLRETAHEGEQTELKQAGHRFTFTNAMMANLISVLSQVAGRKVLDNTGLTGHYDFTLSYAPDRGAASGERSDNLPESVFTALREQLGLDLDARRSQIEFIVVDHIEPLTPN